MKIVLITDEVWNDKLYTNNVLTNWFDGFPAEIANIYLASGIPDNQCCTRYFQITDMMMLKSIFFKKKAGISFVLDTIEQAGTECRPEEENRSLYLFLKFIATESVRLLKDWIWLKGNYNMEKLEEFLSDFNPDIIFCPRFASRKVLRFERLIAELTHKPLVVFTGDDEYTLKQLRFSPVYWLRHFLLRKDLKNTVPLYRKYYTLSPKQADLYRRKFHTDAQVLMKCQNFKNLFTPKAVTFPIKLIYAGRLYCNRWKTLIKLKEALEMINKEEVRMILEIYTKDKVTPYQKKKLNDEVQSYIKNPVTAEELREIYKNADISLHVEAFDLKNRLITKYSFSTKIIDCLASSCAIIAICHQSHPAYQYLKGNRAAICINKPDAIYPVLKKLLLKQELLLKYQKNAWKLGRKNHQKTLVQKKLYDELKEIIQKSQDSSHNDLLWYR